MKTALAAGVAIAALAFAGAAAAQEYNWTGGYVGGSIGGAFPVKDNNEIVTFDTNLDGSFGDTVRTAAGADAFSTGFCGGGANGPTAAAGCTKDKKGVRYAVHAGYDYQMPGSQFVLGGVVELADSNLTDSVTAFSTTPAYYTLDRKVKYEASLRGRVGYAMGAGLVYGTGGITYAKVKNNFSTSNTANVFTDNGNENAWGYKVGGGYEFMLSPQVSLGAQYLFSSLKADEYRLRASARTTAPITPATNPFILVNANGTDFRRDKRMESHSLSATLNFRF